MTSRLSDAETYELAELARVCVRPVVRKMTDTHTGEVTFVPIPCGSTRQRKCGPCADKARKLRMQQCREGWHRTDNPEPVDGSDNHEPNSDAPDADDADGDDGETSSRRRRSTRRREDADDLPKQPMASTTIGRSFTTAEGREFRPSMFLTFTLPSYGPVRDDGTPRNPKTYDYRRAALDALHFPKLVDRLWQNLRRCAGYKVQYFATVEPQQRLALHLHAAARGTIPRAVVRQVVDATYHQVWWPAHNTPVYTERLPIWDEALGGYVDLDDRVPLPTWDQALDALDDDPDAVPAHVIRAGSQFDYQGIIPETEATVSKAIGYLTKYLTKSVADAYDPDTITARQKAHRDRLHAELQWLPCSPDCANWLRYGIQPKGAEPGIVPGECDKPAHQLDNLGHGGRRVLVSRDWTGKTLTDHKADRATVVREVLTEAGIEVPDIDRYAAASDDGDSDGGLPRYEWEPVDILASRQTPGYSDLIRASITERNRWRTQYQQAKEHIEARDGPPRARSANHPRSRPGGITKGETPYE